MTNILPGLSEKVAIVTGASRGIGRAIALELAANKVLVALTYEKNEAGAQETVREIVRLGSKGMACQVDVRNLERSRKFLDEVKATYGKVDFLVNNAGITRDKTLMLMSETDWRDVLETNLYGTFYLTKLVITSFLKQRSGNIVNVSSTAGLIGNAGQVNYSASKAGVIGFTKALAKEVAAYGIRVNAVAPGFIETDMARQLSPNKLEEALKLVPMKRMGSAEEVGKVVAWLLSDTSSYITGQAIPIDGGLAI